ncbi:MAG: DUF1049 domain-containing protein [Proteobacteria bacterium]|jgi:uncharacterized membrane protein YciS (DUF1049 family)|nr:DUF1049 domain-containing protein [Pseudomonadota bacterium]
MTWLKSLLFVCVLILVFLFAALAVNQQQVALSFVRWETPFTLSIFWWLFLALMLGLFLGWLYSLVRHLPLRIQVRKLKKSLAAAELARQKTQDQIDSTATTPQSPQ